MIHIKNFQTFIKESYEQDTAMEKVLFDAMGDDFLDNRAEMLDYIYTILGSRITSWAIQDIIAEYPALANYAEELKAAAELEGYEDYTKEDWFATDDGPHIDPMED